MAVPDVGAVVAAVVEVPLVPFGARGVVTDVGADQMVQVEFQGAWPPMDVLTVAMPAEHLEVIRNP